MAELTERQMSVLESYKSPASALPGSSRLSRTSYMGYRVPVGTREYTSTSTSVKERIIAALGDPEALKQISREQYKVNSGYIEIIEYFKNMFYYRYVVVPTFKTNSKNEKLNPKDLRKLTHEMTDVVDSLSFETIFPKILEKGLVDGVVYLYLYKRNGLPNVLILDDQYCQRYRETNYDTETILFNFDYFREIENNVNSLGVEIKTEDLLSMYPREMINLYKKYKKADGTFDTKYKFQELNIGTAAAIPFHSEGIPPKILVSAAKENYDETVNIQTRKGRGQVDSILNVQIPLDNDKYPIFDAFEAAELQATLATQLKGVDGLKVLTTFGNVDLVKPQQSESVKNEATSNAYNQIFEEAMINPELFRADTDYALSVSLNRDAGFVWTILEKLMNYFNLSLNKTYNFNDYELYVQMLPITKYNFEEQQNAYRRAAEYGIGKLEAVVSTGIKQSIIFDKAELEDALQLDDILKPLQSSHTRSAQELKNIKEGGNIKSEEEEEEAIETIKNEKNDNEKSLENEGKNDEENEKN